MVTTGILKAKKIWLFALAAVTLLFAFNTTSFSAAYVQSWHLVDSGKHLDYDGDSIYMSHITTGAGIWNGYKSGVIRPDSIWVIEDVYVTDIEIANGYTGVTYASGKIELNVYYLSDHSTTRRTNTATHELGHALGLDHSTSTDIMGPIQTTILTLSQNDKDSYDLAYSKY